MNTIPIIIGGGILLFILSQKSGNPITEAFKDNLSFKADDVLIRSLLAQPAIELDVKIRIKNDNLIGGQINKMIGFVSFNGVQIGQFSSDYPMTFPAKEESIFDFDVFIDINDRGLPANIRNIWRSGTFDGSLIITAAIDTNFGQFNFQEKVKVL